jgi:protein-disulfide isomerase
VSATEQRLAIPVTASDHCLGADDAPLTLVEYGDYECPHCARALLIVRGLRHRFGADLRFVFRNLPLTAIHPHAEHAAEAAEAVALQDRFWAMHEILFENQNDLSDQALLRYAAQAGADVDAVTEALTAGATRARIAEDVEGGLRSGVEGTPTFFINGTRHDGPWDLRSLADRLAEELPR